MSQKVPTSSRPNTQPPGIPAYDRTLADSQTLQPQQRSGNELPIEEAAFYRVSYVTGTTNRPGVGGIGGVGGVGLSADPADGRDMTYAHTGLPAAVTPVDPGTYFDQQDFSWPTFDQPSSHGSFQYYSAVSMGIYMAELSFDNFGPAYVVKAIAEFQPAGAVAGMQVHVNDRMWALTSGANTLNIPIGPGRNRVRLFRMATTVKQINFLCSLWRYQSGRFVHPDRITLSP